MKVLIIGNAGSGKSTLGKKLSQKLNLPLYGLDKVVWKKNWVPAPKDERRRLIKDITDKERWLIEGVSKQVFEEADKVYFLDIPTHRCLINILKRFVKNGIGTRKELPESCPEYIGVFKAIRIVFIYNKLTRPWLMSEAKDNKVVHFRSYRELEKCGY